MRRWALALLLGGLGVAVAGFLLQPSAETPDADEGTWIVYSSVTPKEVLHAAPTFLTSFNGSSPAPGTVVGDYIGRVSEPVRLFFTSTALFNATLEASTPDNPEKSLRLWCVNEVADPAKPRTCWLDFVPAHAGMAYRLAWSLEFMGNGEDEPLGFEFRSERMP